MERKLDLTLSGGLLYLRSRACDDAEFDWGPGNRAQGVAIQNGLILLDPLSDEEFGADVILRTPLRFSADKRAQRTLQLPFTVPEAAELAIGSPEGELPVELGLTPGEYTLIFEVCVGHDVFYTFTFVAQACAEARALRADGWGLKKDQVLTPGLF
ncbi:MAG TPA: competence protein ComJ [Moraxellaceae bacterium]|nr:competence protein ComJ [Moraxellaceae bacterium]